MAQETLLKAWRGIGSFRGEALFSTWLGRIAVNATRHHFERAGAQKRRGKVVSIDAGQRGAGEEQPLEITDRTHLPAEWAQRNERQRAILRAVGELEEDYRTAFALRDLHGYSYREIMDTLDLPIGTVKSRIFRARKILQEKLKDLL
ncbi:MAG: sigma-70 family RNA polymerase sigma factor [Planctomycetota bacterium]